MVVESLSDGRISVKQELPITRTPMDSSVFQGVVPAIMTPCNADRTPNYGALVAKAQSLIETGMNAVVLSLIHI